MKNKYVNCFFWITGLIQIVLIILKLCFVISCDWFVVFLPAFGGCIFLDEVNKQ